MQVTALLLLALLSAPHDNTRRHGAKKSAPITMMAPLPCDSSTSCELQLVADDWDGVSSTWTARTGANASIAASPTLAASATFVGRSSINTTNGCFLLPSGNDNITSTSTKTYEVVIDSYGSASAQFVLARRDGSNAQIADWLYKVNGLTLESALYNAAVSVYIGTGGTVVPGTTNAPVFYTVTVDVANHALIVYQNGLVVVNQTGAASGSLNSNVEVGLGIGCRWNAGAREGAFAGKILEVLRHNRVLDAGEVAARVVAFNLYRGY